MLELIEVNYFEIEYHNTIDDRRGRNGPRLS